MGVNRRRGSGLRRRRRGGLRFLTGAEHPAPVDLTGIKPVGEEREEAWREIDGAIRTSFTLQRPGAGSQSFWGAEQQEGAHLVRDLCVGGLAFVEDGDGRIAVRATIPLLQ